MEGRSADSKKIKITINQTKTKIYSFIFGTTPEKLSFSKINQTQRNLGNQILSEKIILNPLRNMEATLSQEKSSRTKSQTTVDFKDLVDLF